jgi:ribosomal protein L31E
LQFSTSFVFISEPLWQRGISESLWQRGISEPLWQRGISEPLWQRGISGLLCKINVECLVQNTFLNSNSDSAVIVKYLISPNYYIQIKKTTGTILINVNFTMIVNKQKIMWFFNYCRCQLGIYNHISLSGVIVINILHYRNQARNN